MIGKDVFRVRSAVIRSHEGRDYFLSGRELFAQLHTGDTIIEYMAIPLSTVTPEWLDHVFVESVKKAVSDHLSSVSEASVSMREAISERGIWKLREIYEEVWRGMLQKDRDDGISYRDYELTFKYLDEAQVFELPDKKLLPAISAEFSDTGEFIFQLGLNRVDGDILVKIKDAYRFFRQNRVAIEIPAGKDVSPEKLQTVFKNRGISLLDSHIVEGEDGFIMFVWFSTEELGGRNANDTFHKLKNLLEKIELIVKGRRDEVLPVNIYLRSTDDGFRKILHKKGSALRMRIMHNDNG